MINKMTSENEEPGRSGFWRTGFLFLTSAALGGIAMAIWNRRALARIRQQAHALESDVEMEEDVFVEE